MCENHSSGFAGGGLLFSLWPNEFFFGTTKVMALQNLHVELSGKNFFTAPPIAALAWQVSATI